MSNHLKNSTSPYLLQHAENPVDWYQWCDTAFEKARFENKPIFLSIGYSTCHWCHVMAHESFEDKRTAAFLNEHFISIKVDREERPDIDSIYMSVCETFTGSGGWPLSIFMTWEKKPFFAGTYFPVHSRYGMPAFYDLLTAIADKWNSDAKELFRSADEITGYLKASEYSRANSTSINDNLPENALQMFKLSFDSLHGGFGTAQKFPIPHNLLFLMLYLQQNNHSDLSVRNFDMPGTDSDIAENHLNISEIRQDIQKNNSDISEADFNIHKSNFHLSKADSDILNMIEKTLTQMRKGGIFDHIGYGFSRYSTDKYFLVPHFEKMLYDNALLIMAYSSVYSITANRLYLDTAVKTADYILREMTSDDGGFFSAQDADSDGIEGKYYTFSFDEILDVLGQESGTRFAKTFDITHAGNFEGVNIPNLLKSNDLTASFTFEQEISMLYQYRQKRAKLYLDDKLLLSWNSLMIAALCMLYRISRDTKYLEPAKKAHAFIEKNLCDNAQLYTSFHSTKHSENAFLDDYAFYTAALIELYHSTLDDNYLQAAERFCREAVKRFADTENGGFYLCESSHTEHFMNPKETLDGAIPSGNSVMTYNLVRLYQLTDNGTYQELALKQISYMSVQAQEYPMGYSMFLLAHMMYENPPMHMTVVLKGNQDLSRLRECIPYFANIKVVSESREYPLINEKTTYYICKNNVCLPPTNSIPDFPSSKM